MNPEVIDDYNMSGKPDLEENQPLFTDEDFETVEFEEEEIPQRYQLLMMAPQARSRMKLIEWKK